MLDRVHVQASFGALCQVRVLRHLIHFQKPKMQGLLNVSPHCGIFFLWRALCISFSIFRYPSFTGSMYKSRYVP